MFFVFWCVGLHLLCTDKTCRSIFSHRPRDSPTWKSPMQLPPWTIHERSTNHSWTVHTSWCIPKLPFKLGSFEYAKVKESWMVHQRSRSGSLTVHERTTLQVRHERSINGRWATHPPLLKHGTKDPRKVHEQSIIHSWSEARATHEQCMCDPPTVNKQYPPFLKWGTSNPWTVHEQSTNSERAVHPPFLKRGTSNPWTVHERSTNGPRVSSTLHSWRRARATHKQL